MLIDTVRKGKPRIVGVGALSDSFSSAMEVCDQIKCLNTDILTVIGGMHATVVGDAILEEYPHVDVVVRGEGETTFLELAERHFKGSDFRDIDGISFRERGVTVRNPDRNLEKNLDCFPFPARHLVEVKRYRTQSVSSSRGCYHHCAFCSIQSQYRHTVRMRSTESLIREIGGLVFLGAKRIMFTDDNFTFSMKRVKELCGNIIKEGYNTSIEFYAEGRIDDICRNPLMAQILGESGFRALYAGAESGSAAIMERYNKKLPAEDVLKGAAYCLEQNLTPVLNFIILGPWDNLDTIHETIDLAKRAFENGAEIAYSEILIPYPGTPIHDQLAEDGKFRRVGNAYYFESYEGISVEWFLQACDLARDLANLMKGKEEFFEWRRAYYELTFLDELLVGIVNDDDGKFTSLKAEAGDLGSRIDNWRSQKDGIKI